MLQSPVWRAFGALVFLVSAIGVGSVPAGAVDAPSIVSGVDIDELARCDIDAFAGTKLVSADAPFRTVRGLAVGSTWVEPLATPIEGRVLVHGVLGDLNHLADALDFDTAASQFGERFHVVFHGADGSVVGETVASPDLPDLGVVAPFALPTVDLTAPAVGVQLRHLSATPDADSVIAVCLNLDVIAPDATPAERTTFQLCPHDSLEIAPDLVCGFIAVPEERSDPTSRLITVFFGVRPGDGTHPDPLVYLEGGPGGPAVPFSGPILDLAMATAAGGREVVFVDQRGTGYSNPNLSCVDPRWFVDGFPFPADESVEAVDAYLQQIAAECQARLRGEGVDLSAFTTIENALDVAELRLGLGVGEWNLFGGSYGTDLALTILRDAPDGVRSVVLDSVFQPEVNPLTDDVDDGVLRALDGMVATCLDDPTCAAAFDDPAADINGAIEALDREPVVVTGPSAELLTGLPAFEFGPSVLLERLTVDRANPHLLALVHGIATADDAEARAAAVATFVRLDAEQVLAELEALLDELNSFDDADPPEILDPAVVARRLGWGVSGPAPEFSDGLYNSVMCAEEAPYLDRGLPADRTGHEWHPLAVEFAADWFRITHCDIWDVAPEDPIVVEPVVSDVPTMLLYTDLDFQTWPEWTERAAETLTDSHLFFYPSLGHVVAFYDVCPQTMIAEFLDNPSVAPDDGCIAGLPAHAYAPTMPVLPPIGDRYLELLEALDKVFADLGVLDAGPPAPDPGVVHRLQPR